MVKLSSRTSATNENKVLFSIVAIQRASLAGQG